MPIRDFIQKTEIPDGTFTGLTYAVWQSEGKTFDKFYKDVSDYPKTTNAINKALDELYTTPLPSSSTDLSLICSVVKSYSDCLLLGKLTFILSVTVCVSG